MSPAKFIDVNIDGEPHLLNFSDDIYFQILTSSFN